MLRAGCAMIAAMRCIGVAGAGTMGTGIAQLAAQSGARALLLDPDAAALARAGERLDELVARGKLDADARARIEPVGGIEALAPCELVIEAAPEDLELNARCSRGSPAPSPATACWRP